MIKPENIYYVGTLQDLGQPYSSLYVDKEEKQLYLFVRVSECVRPTGKYIVTKVSPDDIRAYMNEQIGLSSLFKQPVLYASITDNNMTFEAGNEFTPNKRMRQLDYFNPELCDDEVWVDTFIDHFSNNLPLEIAS